MLFERLVGKACEQLRSLGDFRDEPDIADDMFLLAGRGLSYCPTIVLTPVSLPRLLDAATAGVLVQHRCAKNLRNLKYHLEETLDSRGVNGCNGCLCNREAGCGRCHRPIGSSY